MVGPKRIRRTTLGPSVEIDTAALRLAWLGNEQRSEWSFDEPRRTRSIGERTSHKGFRLETLVCNNHNGLQLLSRVQHIYKVL